MTCETTDCWLIVYQCTRKPVYQCASAPLAHPWTSHSAPFHLAQPPLVLENLNATDEWWKWSLQPGGRDCCLVLAS